MSMYSGAVQTYLEAGQLVKSQGGFQGAAAELKSLTAGTGITLTEGADAITVDGTSTLTATLPLSISASGELSIDLSDYATDFDLSAKQDNLTVYAPLNLTNNLLTIDLSAYAIASGLPQATCKHLGHRHERGQYCSKHHEPGREGEHHLCQRPAGHEARHPGHWEPL